MFWEQRALEILKNISKLLKILLKIYLNKFFCNKFTDLQPKHELLHMHILRIFRIFYEHLFPALNSCFRKYTK